MFDALRERLEPERLPELDQSVGERVRLVRAREVGDERAIDLERIDRELPQVCERAVTGAEVIDRDANTERLQRLEQLHRRLGPAHQDRLGDLERERQRV